MTRELFSADPPVKLANLARGSAFFKLTVLRVIAVQALRGSDARIRKSYLVQNLPLPAFLVLMLRFQVVTACRTITRQYP